MTRGAVRAVALLDAALEYAMHGDPVFPVWHADGARCGCRAYDCERPAKHPIASCAPNGLKDATTGPATLTRWWQGFPHAGIAMRTGLTCAVLDVDPAHGGAYTIAQLEARYGALPHTPRVRTGGGGEHVYFAPVPGLRNSAGKIGPGLDVRAEDGYALLPPSSHVSGRRYADDPDAPMYETPRASMPAWLLALAMADTPGSSNGRQPRSADEWAAKLAGAPEGQRRAVALEIAGHYLGLKIAEAEVTSIVLGYAARCAPPFPEGEVRELVRDLARRDRVTAGTRREGQSSAPAPPCDGLELVPLGELLGEPDEAHAWVVDQRLPAAGLGLLAGKPKAGKSTLARCLALAVARGTPWLGFATRQGPVLYLALEEKRAEVRAHFRALGATAADPIFLLCSSAPLDALARLRREAERRGPVLIIIDPLFRLVRVDDGNDYATMTAALEPLMTLARETGAHVLLVHHLRKAERAGADAILGSTAILGAVDTALLMWRGERYRTIESIQRYGDDLAETTVALDPVTRNVVAGGSRVDAELADAGRLVREALAAAPGPVTEAELDGVIECRRQLWKRALRALVGTGTVVRTGRGGKTDPFRYCGSPIYREPGNQNAVP